ncbi:hypothetical protein DJ568_14895 [Mucilaginibacter hurinus]|uniref:Calcineurin-like phosphoesterase domain-containing protein n=1 Tax=Mucilaginibacter hurinus TaxID=2201324 RepID=A0A367GKI6_9SPHI|nr:metallophosphoesterase [Mucilaginibacter hurinus]RCH53830.1 hypothetical protein DJ568_14895 [Mucilaginibacter hurinus]
MGNVIIHISDLHISTKVDDGGITNARLDSYLTTDDEAASTHYVATFTDTVKKDFPNETLHLLITGDISDSGEKIQFSEAKRLITKIMGDLNIPVERLLLLPGDHDVHRRSLQNETEQRPNRNSHLLNSIKFQNFAEFYKDVTLKDFPFDNVIVDHMIVDSVVFVGFNSNYKINAGGGLGHIPISKFNEEINQLKQSIDSGKQWVACWHHNLTAGYDNSNNGQWETENRQHLLSEIERQEIKLIVSGNEHIMDAKTVLSIYTSDSGTFSTIKYESSFKAYILTTGDEIALENKMFALQPYSGNDLKYFWDARNNLNAKQLDRFVLYKANTQVIQDIKDIPSEPEASDSDNETDVTQKNVKSVIRYDNPAFSDKLYNLVREKKLFHSGHFLYNTEKLTR